MTTLAMVVGAIPPVGLGLPGLVAVPWAPVAAVLFSVVLGRQALTATLVASALGVIGGVALAQRG